MNFEKEGDTYNCPESHKLRSWFKLRKLHFLYCFILNEYLISILFHFHSFFSLNFQWHIAAQTVKILSVILETQVQALGGEDPLEEGMATHSSIFAWRIPMDRGAWWDIVRGVAELDTTEHLTLSLS